MSELDDHDGLRGQPHRGVGVSTQRELPGVLPMSAVAAVLPVDPSARPTESEPQAAPTAGTAGPSGSDTRWAREFGATNAGSTPYAVAVDGDVVYLGGDFAGPMAGMPEGTFNRIARWDGVAWQPMGRGLDGTVHAIVVVGDSVYVGGEFSVAGGKIAASRLARWDGSTWSAVGGGVSSTSNPQLAAVARSRLGRDELFVAGTFESVGSGASALQAAGIAAFSPEAGSWEAYGDGLRFLDGPGEGRALVVSGGRVYVGGYFDRAGTIETGSLASLDAAGTWTGYGTGIRNDEFVGSVDTLAVDESTGTVYVGGSFTAADSVATSGVATLAGDRYGTLGAFLRFGDAATAGVSALAFSNGRLYAGGEFTTAGNAAAERWAVYDGTDWALPGDGVDNVVRALAPLGSGVVVAGDFVFSGPLRVPSAGIWTGSAWQSFGEGLSYDPYADGNVYAVVPLGPGAYVGGYFDQAGAVPVGSVARWTGQGWEAMAGGVRGADSLGTVYAMAQLGEDLYVTGSFAAAGTGSAANIARWDGTAWSALGSGLNDTGYALAVLGGRLYVGRPVPRRRRHRRERCRCLGSRDEHLECGRKRARVRRQRARAGRHRGPLPGDRRAVQRPAPRRCRPGTRAQRARDLRHGRDGRPRRAAVGLPAPRGRRAIQRHGHRPRAAGAGRGSVRRRHLRHRRRRAARLATNSWASPPATSLCGTSAPTAPGRRRAAPTNR